MLISIFLLIDLKGDVYSDHTSGIQELFNLISVGKSYSLVFHSIKHPQKSNLVNCLGLLKISSQFTRA